MPQRLKLKEHQQLPYLTVLRKMRFILPVLKLPDNTSLTRNPKFSLLKTGYSNSLVSTSPFSRHVGQKIV